MTARKKLVLGTVASLLALVLLGFAMLSLFSKAPATLGVHDGRLSPCPSSPNCVCSYDDDKRHAIDTLKTHDDPSADLDRLVQIIEKLPRTKVVTQAENYLHVEFTSLIFRFVDDVEFLVDSEQGKIHVRSASRVGYSDMGVNRRRIEHIRTLWNAE
ncbi:MAG TPA: DUF1499 domain-containing protein [Planctomycetaceae bacterium]|nr:DUF1499 domain-containing protein [Planctomycetaceae bacterium]